MLQFNSIAKFVKCKYISKHFTLFKLFSLTFESVAIVTIQPEQEAWHIFNSLRKFVFYFLQAETVTSVITKLS